jgi:hypothetical protein
MIPKKVPSKKQSDQWRLTRDTKATLAVHQGDMLSFFLKTLHIFKTEMVVRFVVLCLFKYQDSNTPSSGKTLSDILQEY